MKDRAGRKISYRDKTVETGEVAFFVVARLPGSTMCKNTVWNWQRLGKVNHPHAGMVVGIIDHQQRTTYQLTHTHTQTDTRRDRLTHSQTERQTDRHQRAHILTCTD